MRRSLALAAALLAAGALVATAAERGPLVAAHRGEVALWPENSLRAFRWAFALGVDVLETDLHLTADGEVVVVHDPTLERTTTGTGPVRDRTLADLGLYISVAKISTKVDQVADTFYVKDIFRHKISAADKVKEIQRQLLASLEE